MKKIVLALTLLVFLGGAGYLILSSKDESSKQPVSQKDTSAKVSDANKISISNLAYSPAEITVKKGTAVMWVNNDSVPHTVTSTDGGKLDGSLLAKGSDYTFTFDTVGTFNYKCSFHSNMTGKVIVTE